MLLHMYMELNYKEKFNHMKVVIIGAGISGLTAGIYALKQGYEAEIYEKNTSAGGMCTGWYRKGTYIDGCLHWLTESAAGSLHEIWKETGALTIVWKSLTAMFFTERFMRGKT